MTIRSHALKLTLFCKQTSIRVWAKCASILFFIFCVHSLSLFASSHWGFPSWWECFVASQRCLLPEIRQLLLPRCSSCLALLSLDFPYVGGQLHGLLLWLLLLKLVGTLKAWPEMTRAMSEGFGNLGSRWTYALTSALYSFFFSVCDRESFLKVATCVRFVPRPLDYLLEAESHIIKHRSREVFSQVWNQACRILITLVGWSMSPC